MIDRVVENLKKDIAEAELVLIGIGEEMGMTEREIIENAPEIFDSDEKSEQELGYLVRYQMMHDVSEEYVQAMQNIYEWVCDKNYFVISTNTDGILKRTSFREDRMVFPCGGYERLQCPAGCQDVWREPEPCWDEYAEKIIRQKGEKEYRPALAVCPECGRELVFHNIYAEKYREEGYLEQWNAYTKWLQGTVNRKFCILEFGVGMRFPTVIRWPFEKMAAYNQKAFLYRVHSSLYQLPDTLGERGIAIAQNPKDFIRMAFGDK